MKNVKVKRDEFVTTETLNEILEQTANENDKRKWIIETRDINRILYTQQMKQYKKLIEHKEQTKMVKKPTANKQEIEQEKTKVQELYDVSFYLDQIKECTSLTELQTVLPRKNHPDFNTIMNTILASLLKEIIEIEEFVSTEKLTKSERQEFLNEIHAKQAWINEMILYRDQKMEQKEESIQNHLIYLASSSNNIYAFQDLKDIEQEYFGSFLELLNSILDGTFKNVKKFSNNNKINTLYEVKNFKTRIVFNKINANTFVIVSMFMKKADNDLRYREQIVHRSTLYQSVKEELKRKSQETEFLEANKEITETIQNILMKKGVSR